jgi:hypothetical protein
MPTSSIAAAAAVTAVVCSVLTISCINADLCLKMHAGHELCREGDEADCLWLLQEGELLCIRGNRQVRPGLLISLCTCTETGRYIPYICRAIEAMHLFCA